MFRQLNEGVGDSTIPKFVTFCVFVAIVAFVIYENADTVKLLLGYLFFALLLVIAIFTYLLAIKPHVEAAKRYNKAPAEGPMQINVTTKELETWTGKPKYELCINVQFSKRDLDAFERAGIKDWKLFDYPDYKFPEATRTFDYGFLLFPTRMWFHDIGHMLTTKEKLMTNIQYVRNMLDRQVSHSDAQKTGETKESFEI